MLATAEELHWLKCLALNTDPWCKKVVVRFGMGPIELNYETVGDAVMVKAGANVHVQEKWTVPTWVSIAFGCAAFLDHVTDDASPDAEARAVWHAFMLIGARDPAMQAAVESVFLLSGKEPAVAYMKELFEVVARKLAGAHVMQAIAERQRRRERRISGRPGFAGDPVPRPTDDELAAEALPPRVDRKV